MISYYAIIPANVRYDKDLTPNAKLLYAEITALCNQTGRCWATNQYFANLYNVSTTSISKWISQLVAKGYIHSEIEYREGTKEILNRYLSLVKGGIEEKLNTPIEEKLKDNNININTKINKDSAPEKFCFKSELLKIGLNEKLCNEWLDVRKKKRGINTERSLEILKKQLELSGLDINQLIEIAVNKCWVMPEAKYRDVKEASIKLTSIDVRRANFKAEILKFNNEVDIDTLKKFFAFYTQVNDGIMKFEAEEYFNVRNRLFNFKSK